jgi:pectinesterase
VKRTPVVLLLLIYAHSVSFCQSGGLTIRVKNDLDLVRPSETVSLSMKDIAQALQIADLKKTGIHVMDPASGQELLAQSIDMDGDGGMDLFIFQVDFKPLESRTFTLEAGPPQLLTKDQFKAYGRFVRERYDDFAWENDRIAHRMYGTALETWQAEPLTSSAVDVWVKRVRRLVINDWYMVDNYHTDTGEGADFYSANKARGCGGSGIWQDGKLFVSRNFINSKVIASGPIRVAFELTYAPWDAGGRMVSEVKRVTLDAGQNFDRFESFYKTDPAGPLTFAAGIKNNAGSTVISERRAGWLRTWEPLQKGQAGNLGCAILMDPASIADITQADGNYLIVAKSPASGPASYYAGFGWDRSGDFAGLPDWEAYVRQFARRVASPLKITISR